MWVTDTVENLCEIEYGTRVVRKREQGTIYPVYGGGGETFRIDRKNRTSRVAIARFGMSERCTRFVDGDFFLNDSGLTLSPKSDELSQNFLNKIIFSLNDRIYRIGRGTAQKNLNMDAFKKLIISYPPLTEQERIVAKLDAAFAGIDEAVNAVESKESEVQALKTSILNKLLNSKSNGWESSYLEGVSSFISRGISPKYIESGGVRVLNQKCIRNHHINYDLARRHDIDLKKVSEERFIRLGDILINSTGQGTLGRVAQVRKEPDELTTIDSHITIVRPKSELFYLDYFGYAAIAIEKIIHSHLKANNVQAQGEWFNINVKCGLEILELFPSCRDNLFKGVKVSEGKVENVTDLVTDGLHNNIITDDDYDILSQIFETADEEKYQFNNFTMTT